jgi:hypothetical protein
MTERRRGGTFLPGHSPGRPKGVRNRLQSTFLYALAEDFEKHGADAIKICRVEEPARYVQIVASLMPRELEIEHQTATSDLDDEQLDNLITQIRQHLLETKPMKVIEPKSDKVLIERKTNG